MARYLFFTDPHVNAKLFNHVTPQGYPARGPEIMSTFVWLSEVCEKKAIDRAVMGGDLFNSVANLQFPHFNMAFAGLFNIKVPLDLLDGNHDKYDSIYKALDPFKVFARVHSTPVGYYDNAVGLRTVFVPFQRSVEELGVHLSSLLRQEEETVVFIHQGPQGYVPDPLAYNKKVFDRKHIKKVFGGHYHFKFEEKVGNDPMKLVYPGSVLSLHFDDHMSAKYAVVWDSKTNELEWLENPHSAFFISLNQSEVLRLKDELEQVAAVSYIRVVLKEGEAQRVPMSYLLKFKGYIMTTGKDDSPQYKMGDASQTDFDYEEFSKMLSSNSSQLSFDLKFDDFRGLIMQSAEEQALIKQTAQHVLDEVFQHEYAVGMTR